ncbi:MAG: sulfur carrier protein ThiS [Thermodesulfobacteriota bacterium]
MKEEHTATLKVVVNGLPEEVPPRTSVQALIELLNEQDAGLLVEINGYFVHQREFPTREIEAGDRIELIHPAFGG